MAKATIDPKACTVVVNPEHVFLPNGAPRPDYRPEYEKEVVRPEENKDQDK